MSSSFMNIVAYFRILFFFKVDDIFYVYTLHFVYPLGLYNINDCLLLLRLTMEREDEAPCLRSRNVYFIYPSSLQVLSQAGP